MRLMRCLMMVFAVLLLAGAVQAETLATPATNNAVAPGNGASLTGVWEGTVLFASVRAELVQEPEMVNDQAYPFTGVVTMRSGSDKAVYHVFGFVNDEAVAGMHPPSGAQFMGSLFSPDELRGTITLKSGQQITLTAFRKPGPPPATP